jgi:hypothetical protein
MIHNNNIFSRFPKLPVGLGIFLLIVVLAFCFIKISSAFQSLMASGL